MTIFSTLLLGDLACKTCMLHCDLWNNNTSCRHSLSSFPCFGHTLINKRMLIFKKRSDMKSTAIKVYNEDVSLLIYTCICISAWFCFDFRCWGFNNTSTTFWNANIYILLKLQDEPKFNFFDFLNNWTWLFQFIYSINYYTYLMHLQYL